MQIYVFCILHVYGFCNNFFSCVWFHTLICSFSRWRETNGCSECFYNGEQPCRTYCCVPNCEIQKFIFPDEFKSGVLKDVSFAKMSDSCTNVQIQLGRTFFIFTRFYAWLWMFYINFQVDNGIVHVLKDQSLIFFGN